MDWKPIKIDKHDLKELFSTSARIFVSLKRDVEGLAVSNTENLETKEWSELTTDNNLKAISYSAIFQVKRGMRFSLFFFGNDPEMLRGNFFSQSHVRHLASVWGGDAE
jgi:hypothetical protein